MPPIGGRQRSGFFAYSVYAFLLALSDFTLTMGSLSL